MTSKHTSWIYIQDSASKEALIKLNGANDLKIQLNVKNSDFVLVSGNEANHNSLLSLLENNSNFVIFYDGKHPKSKRNVFKSYMRKTPSPSPSSATGETKVVAAAVSKGVVTAKGATAKSAASALPAAAAPTTMVNRTAKWYANYYNFPPVAPPTAPGTAATVAPTPVYIAVISLGGSYAASDLKYYSMNICGNSAAPNVLNVPVNQSLPVFTGSDEDMENTLDLEIITAVCPTATVFFVSAPNTTLGFLEAFSTAINGITVGRKVYQPTVVSCSWGAPESEFTPTEMQTYNALFASGANKGVSILVASGDNASSDGASASALKPSVDFPSSSPWVLSVGGTSVPLSATSGAPGTPGVETSWSYNPTHRWGGGGGCSGLFPMASWQNGIVSLPINTKPNVSYLAGKRALPDVALSADPLNGYTIFMSGKTYLNSIGGTSCAAPLMAGFLGLTNLRYPISVGASLYAVYRGSKKSTCFKDITTGGTDDLVGGSVGIWNAGVGFDMCTGMGSINGKSLVEAIVL